MYLGVPKDFERGDVRFQMNASFIGFYQYRDEEYGIRSILGVVPST
jgi:hypothetical protein